MRMRRMLLAIVCGLVVSAVATADERVGYVEDDSRTAESIRELVRRGAVVKRFAVAESQTSGVLVRLKTEHLDRDGRIESEVLATLAPLCELMLELRGVPLSDAGMKSLLSNVRLVGLDVSGSRVSDVGLTALATTNSRLRLLDLSFTRVTDAGLSCVAAQTELRHLALTECRVSDCGLARLSCLAELRELYLAKTCVSADAVERLRQQRPSCRVQH